MRVACNLLELVFIVLSQVLLEGCLAEGVTLTEVCPSVQLGALEGRLRARLGHATGGVRAQISAQAYLRIIDQ